MTDFEVLSEMIKATARVEPTTKYGRSVVTLREPASPSSTVIIRGLPDSAVVIKSDSWPSPGKIFDGRKGECKRADYAIVADVDGKTVLIFIEMKTGISGKREDIVKQLAGAECFLDYCQSIGKQFWRKADFLSQARHRFVCFKQTGSIRKKRTYEIREEKKHDKPDKFLRIDSPAHVEFNKLASMG